MKSVTWKECSGNLPEARSIYQETIKRWQELGNRSAVAHELECFGFIAIAGGQPERAARLFGAAEALREMCQSPMTDEERVEYDQWVAELRGKLAEAEYQAAWEQGRRHDDGTGSPVRAGSRKGKGIRIEEEASRENDIDK